MKKIYYHTPLKNGLDKKIDYGDPYIYRYNGSYYLFTTGASPKRTQGHVYKSKDLVNYEYLGQFSNDEIALGAFAPEIIYAFSYFYLVTSPLGKGHYVFRSKNIEGPYERITDNIGLLIDGSFTLSKDNKLYFLYASREGIMMAKMDKDGKTKNHHLISSSLDGWTEGGSIVQRGGKYYLFYCGNHFLAEGYRINCAISDTLEGPYVDIKNNPLLIACELKYTRLGHSSETISPDLCSRLIMYHGKTSKMAPRDILLAKLRFDNDLVSVNHSTLYRSEFSAPTFEESNISLNEENIYLSDKKMNKEVNIEAFFNDSVNLLFSYKNSSFYSYIKLVDGNICLFKKRNDKDRLVHCFKTGFEMNYPHTLRLLKEDNSINLYIDDAFISSVDASLFNYGYVGYQKVNEYSKCGYLCFFNIKNDNNHPITIPGSILNNELVKINDNEYQVKILSSKDDYYHLSLSMSFDSDLILNINDQEFKIQKNQHYFNDDNIYVGKVFIKKNSIIKIKTSAKTDIKYLNLILDRQFKIYNSFLKKGNYLVSNQKNDNYFLFSDIASYPSLSMDFKILNNRRYHSFAFLINVTDFSKEDFQARYHFNGLMVEYDGHLVNISEVNYQKNDLFDFRLEIEENKIHNFKIEYYQNYLYLYFDNNLIKKFLMNSKRNVGRYGFYMANGTDVEIINFKKEESLV
ncbi:MAG: family 43 glycosylhydrolase [Bacilli bacterium]